MPSEQRFDEIWIGKPGAGYYGCGIIVGSHHILTCDHVVREALGKKSNADQNAAAIAYPDNDLVDQIVVGETRGGEIKLRVIANRSLPEFNPGKHNFDDLCIMERCDNEPFPDSAIARLLAKAHAEIGDGHYFSGQGVVATEGPNSGFISIPFDGVMVRDSIQFRHWHHVDFPNENLEGEKGCSGAAAISKTCGRAVVGLIHGGLKQQIGLLIPAWHLAAYLAANGVAPRWWEKQPPLVGRPTKIRAIRKTRPLGITEEHLDDCDRRPQIEKFNPASDAFFASGNRLFLALVMGEAHDMPELLDKRLAYESIDGFLSHWQYVLEKSVSRGMKGKFPWYTIKLRETDQATIVEDVYRLIADRNISDSSLGRLIGNPKAIAGKLNEVDAPTVITVWFQSQILDAAAMQSWRDALNRIAEFRRDLPIFVFFFAHPSQELGELNGVVSLGELEPIKRRDIEDWIAGRLRKDLDLKWSSESEKELLSRLKSDSFRMRELQDWISN